ncbi:MAG: GNAT family N-acetyltransferase [Pseudooceanicola sp.]|nr:GNAT family N-acetyltransferase [Pseudooceanicola sp.]
MIPTLTTDRLTLRGPREADFDAVAGFFADGGRSDFFGGPLTRGNAWRWFAMSIGHWQLKGFGFWMVELTATGQHCGLCGLWQPEGWPEPELGWAVFEGFEGMGIAKEAALAARAFAYGTLGWTTLTSNIMPGNTRSIALAERLGARLDRRFDNPLVGEELVYRHPAPEAAS